MSLASFNRRDYGPFVCHEHTHSLNSSTKSFPSVHTHTHSTFPTVTITLVEHTNAEGYFTQRGAGIQEGGGEEHRVEEVDKERKTRRRGRRIKGKELEEI